MFEEKTFDVILSDMLSAAPDGIDISVGSIFYDAVVPVAAELAKLYKACSKVASEMFPDTASREYLIRRGAEYGIKPIEATRAVLRGEFDIYIPEGSKFTLSDYVYTIGKITADNTYSKEYEVICDTPGTKPNSVGYGDLIPVSYIQGLSYSRARGIITPGQDEESTEAFRVRVLRAAAGVPFGGNAADYIKYVSAIDGVGGVKVFPAYAGGGTVKIVVQAKNYGVPSSSLINSIKNTLDPTNKTGLGFGIAPIGHSVAVEGVNSYTVTIKTSVTYATGWNQSTASSLISSAVSKYVSALAAKWASVDNCIIHIADIDSAILSTGCVTKVTGTTIYDNTSGSYVSSSITLDSKTVPVFGSVTFV